MACLPSLAGSKPAFDALLFIAKTGMRNEVNGLVVRERIIVNELVYTGGRWMTVA